MSQYRTQPQRDFTTIRNDALRDPRLSLKAKGTLAMMLSYPPDWTFRQTHLEKLSTDGRDSLRGAIRELEACGYIRRDQRHAQQGRFGRVDYVVGDNPTADGFSGDGQPGDGLSGDGKPATTNTEVTKTESTKTEKTTPPTPPIRAPRKSTDTPGPGGEAEEALRGLYNEDARKTLKRTDREAYKQLEQASASFKWNYAQKNLAAEVILERRDEALAALRQAAEGANTIKGSAYRYWQAILNGQKKQPAKSGPDSVDELLKLTGATGHHPDHGPFTVTMVSNDGRTLLTDNTPPLPPEEVRSCLTT